MLYNATNCNCETLFEVKMQIEKKGHFKSTKLSLLDIIPFCYFHFCAMQYILFSALPILFHRHQSNFSRKMKCPQSEKV